MNFRVISIIFSVLIIQGFNQGIKCLNKYYCQFIKIFISKNYCAYNIPIYLYLHDSNNVILNKETGLKRLFLNFLLNYKYFLTYDSNAYFS